jgi:hypothetical protein
MSFYEIFVGELVELTTREQISGFYEDEENGPVQGVWIESLNIR